MKPLGYFFLLGLGSCAAGLQAMDLQTLVDRSPFAPPGGAANNGPAAEQPGTLEFRGMVVDAQGTSYSVFDVSASRGYWVREGGDGAIRVKSYNAQESMLEVEQNGKPVKLQLKRATIQAGAPIAIAQPRQNQNPGVPMPGGGPGGPGGNVPEARRAGDAGADARRLEAVAAEVRRRRALRNAAKPPGAGEAAPAPATPAPQ